MAFQTIRWILLGLALEVIASVIRIIYFVGGPLQSSDTFTIPDHAYLLFISNPFEVMTVSILLFERILLQGLCYSHYS